LNIFDLAVKQLEREEKEVTDLNIVDYAIKIRKYLNKHPEALN
jgi:hypothetical protein